MADIDTGAVEKSEAAKREERILEFWERTGAFKKSLDKDAPAGDFVFYDGPPFATGLPHHGHILASTIKDTIPRYKTMRGYRVRRRWGWDCHGLPLENIIEKELGIKTKRDIEEMGVGQFNEAARSAVLRYADEWKKIVPRLGRWVDMEDDYKTMDTSYTESVWWAFSELHRKGLIEEGFKVMQYCPRCGTTLSNFEVSQGYKDIKDLTATAKFELAEEAGTYFLAWTTTPWTLPGNVALAVGPDIEYAKVRTSAGTYILANERVGDVMRDEAYETIETLTGKELVGIAYRPVFPGVADALAEGRERDKLGAAFKVYAGDFVTTGEGTGIVHIAPAFGEEDLGLARAHGLPVIHHVDRDGRMMAAVPAVAGRLAKPKGQWWETDTLIVEHLGDRLYRAEEKLHSYPHCWRCDTPLLNYASGSWFVSVPAFKDKLVSENARVGWVPEAIGQNRFGDWLQNARDWAISRSRYWGAPIPVWKNERTGELKVFGSVADLTRHAKRSGNRYFVMRHGEAGNNIQDLLDSSNAKKWPLTETGRVQAKKGAEHLAGKRITTIYASPFERAKETAEIVADALGMDRASIVFDEQIREFDFGDLDGSARSDFIKRRDSMGYDEKVPGGESYQDAKSRFGAFLYRLEREHADENILIVSHGIAVETLLAVACGAAQDESMSIGCERDPGCGEPIELDFTPLPHNESFELDLHRPYIDEYEVEENGIPLHRVTDVFDCWFESGSMPYAQDHYPFEKGNFDPKGGWFKKIKGYPADFIAEGLDQTRGWFYSLIVLGVALFDRAPYKHVIVNGLILAEDGRKMSKSLKNYPEPMDVIAKYGADALRLYLLSSPVMRAEDLRFSERGVGEVGNKVLGRLHNMLVFYETYAKELAGEEKSEADVLDAWVLARLQAVRDEITAALDAYELDRATRPLGELVDDLSTWYLRRSRDRVKSSPDAAATLRFILREAALLFAPFAPFYAEHLFQAVRYGRDAESVHLMDWPESQRKGDQSLMADMRLVRELASEALKLRQQKGVKVRQPLATLTAPSLPANPDLLEILKDEVNVKELRVGGSAMELDTALTPELVREGDVREFMRALADARKDLGLSPKDQVALIVSPNGEALLAGAELPGVATRAFAETSGHEAQLSEGPVLFSIRVHAS